MGKEGKGKTNRFLSTSYVPIASFLPPLFANSCHRMERIGGKGNFLLPPVNSLFSKSAPEKKRKEGEKRKRKGGRIRVSSFPFYGFLRRRRNLECANSAPPPPSSSSSSHFSFIYYPLDYCN